MTASSERDPRLHRVIPRAATREHTMPSSVALPWSAALECCPGVLPCARKDGRAFAERLLPYAFRSSKGGA